MADEFTIANVIGGLGIVAMLGIFVAELSYTVKFFTSDKRQSEGPTKLQKVLGITFLVCMVSAVVLKRLH